MSATSCPEGYQVVELDQNKVDALIDLLHQVTAGPAEAIALLHSAIAEIDSAYAGHRSAKSLGEELTFDLIASGVRET